MEQQGEAGAALCTILIACACLWYAFLTLSRVCSSAHCMRVPASIFFMHFLDVVFQQSGQCSRSACHNIQLTSCSACTSSPQVPRSTEQAVQEHQLTSRMRVPIPAVGSNPELCMPRLRSALAQALRLRPACGSRRPPQRAPPARRPQPPPTSTRAPPGQTAGRHRALPYPCAARPAAAPAGPRARAPAVPGPAGPLATPAAPAAALALSLAHRAAARAAAHILVTSGNPGQQQRQQASQRLSLSAHGYCW